MIRIILGTHIAYEFLEVNIIIRMIVLACIYAHMHVRLLLSIAVLLLGTFAR